MRWFLSIIVSVTKQSSKQFWTAVSLLLFTMTNVAYAQGDPFHSSPYPIPRFVSLASDEVNVRTGQGPKYPVKWVYTTKNRPVEVILEYDAWRKVKDMDGEQGWVHGTL